MRPVTPLRLGLAGPAIALILFASAPAAAQPAPTPQGDVVPAKADEGPTTLGPLPVATDQADSKPAAPPPAASEDLDEPDSMAATMFRTLLVLGVVVGLIYLSLNFGLRKLMGIKGMPGRSGLVQVVERVPLDPKRTLFVVKAGGEFLLLGGADQNLSLISKLDAAQVTALLDQQRRNALQPSPFLQKLLQKEKPATPAEQHPPSEKV